MDDMTRRAIEPALEPYFDLLTRFVTGIISADEIEQEFLIRYKSDPTRWSRPTFDAHERFFYAVDDYVSDPALRTSDGDLDADQLRTKAAEVLNYIKGSGNVPWPRH